MNALRIILRAFFQDDGAPSMYGGLLIGAPGSERVSRPVQPRADSGKTRVKTQPPAADRS